MPLVVGKVRVDVSLCGAIPRSWSSPADSAPQTANPPKGQNLVELTSSDLNSIRESVPDFSCMATNGYQLSTQANRSKSLPTAIFSGDSFFSATNSFDTLPSGDKDQHNRDPMLLAQIEPPHWAVPARDNARLKPVCEALGSHASIDLTTKSCFRVGRSPGSDIQLVHNTSSRRHALVFHHPNGGCYVVDCGSSHGTFINGVRVRSTPVGGMVIPQRVRRGSLVRFGGPGAPLFVLKSFAVGFSSSVQEMNSVDSLSPVIDAEPDAEAVAIHSRMKAASPPLEGGILKKRSFEECTDSASEPKRQRCVSPSSTMLENGPIALVSPESPRKSKRVSFDEHPGTVFPVLVSPDDVNCDYGDAIC